MSHAKSLILVLAAGFSGFFLFSDIALAQTLIRPTPYMPLDVGNSWTYRAGSQKVVVRVVKREPVGDVECAVVEAVNGDAKSTEHITSLKKGIYRYMANGKKVTPPLLVLKLPVKKEESWEVDSKKNDTVLKGKFTVGEEEITVPKGKFKTITVSCDDLQFGSRYISLKYWFAENVGMVKQEIQIDGVRVTLELVDYKVAK